MTARLAVIRECYECPHGIIDTARKPVCYADGDRYRALPVSSTHGPRPRIPEWCPLPKASRDQHETTRAAWPKKGRVRR